MRLCRFRMIDWLASAALALAMPQVLAQAVHGDPLQPIDQNPSYQQARVKDVMHVLAVSINKKDFADFQASGSIATAFKRQFSDEQMKAAFKELIDSGVDLTHLDAMTPAIDGTPQVTLFNGIDIKGHYDSTPITTFDFAFIREGAQLVATSVNVHVGGAAPPPAPAAAHIEPTP